MLRVLPPTKQTLQPYLLQDRFVGSKTRSITQSTRFAALCCKTSCTFFFCPFYRAIFAYEALSSISFGTAEIHRGN